METNGFIKPLIGLISVGGGTLKSRWTCHDTGIRLNCCGSMRMEKVTQKSSPKWWWKNGDLPWYHPFLKSPNKTNPSFRTKFLRIQGEFTIPNTPSKSCIYQSMNG